MMKRRAIGRSFLQGFDRVLIMTLVLLLILCLLNNAMAIFIWNPSKAYDENKEDMINRFKLDMVDTLENETISIGTLKQGIYHEADEPYDGPVQSNGLVEELRDILQSVLGFKYTMKITPDNKYGLKQSDGTWSGLMGLLHRKEVDMAIAVFEPTEERTQVVDFAPPAGQSHYVFMMQRSSLLTSSGALLAPFSPEAWIATFLTLVILGPLVWTMVQVKKSVEGIKEVDSDSNSLSLLDCVWFVYGAILKQGSVLHPYMDSLRVIFMTWWLGVLILTSFYTANLTAYLTSTSFSPPVQTIEDVQNDPAYSMVVSKGTSMQSFMQNLTAEGKFEADRVKVVLNQDEGVKLVSQGYVYMSDIESHQRIIFDEYVHQQEKGADREERCPYYLTELPITTFKYTFIAYRKDFEHQDLINKMLIKVLEAGLLERSLRRNTWSTELCILTDGLQQRALKTRDFTSTFQICVGGCTLALALLIFEHTWKGSLLFKNKCCGDDQVKASHDLTIPNSASPAFRRRSVKNRDVTSVVENTLTFRNPHRF